MFLLLHQGKTKPPQHGAMMLPRMVGNQQFSDTQKTGKHYAPVETVSA